MVSDRQVRLLRKTQREGTTTNTETAMPTVHPMNRQPMMARERADGLLAARARLKNSPGIAPPPRGAMCRRASSVREIPFDFP